MRLPCHLGSHWQLPEIEPDGGAAHELEEGDRLGYEKRSTGTYLPPMEGSSLLGVVLFIFSIYAFEYMYYNPYFYNFALNFFC